MESKIFTQRHLLSGSSSSRNNMDIDIEEIDVMPPISHTSSSKKLKTNKVVPHDVIEIDEDEDTAGILNFGMDVSLGNKGKAIKQGHDYYWKYQDSSSSNPVGPAGTSDLGLMNGVPYPPLNNSGPGLQNSIYLDKFISDLTYDDDDDDVYDDSLCWQTQMELLKQFHAPPDFKEDLQAKFDKVDFPPWVEASVPWFQDIAGSLEKPVPWFQDPAGIQEKPVPWFQDSAGIREKPVPWFQNPAESQEKPVPWFQNPAGSQEKAALTHGSLVPRQSSSCNVEENKYDNVPKKLGPFKQFDTVQDYSDHYYNKGTSSIQPSKVWSKEIQKEWKILEKSLPDTIFVRVYEGRMDLMRAVITGPAGTPYHDGLFFFDVFFPFDYPNSPPQVNYHAGGLRLNPNLYATGKVCLSLLNTWSGNRNERWSPGKSTVLQVLVSIQALVLNAKPYFNEPGHEQRAGTAHGERQSQIYSENTFILSLKTMMYTLRRPPKHFEEFVKEHFRKCGRDILVSCKAYMQGAQVGCLVKGGVQDVDEGDKSCSSIFKAQVADMVNILVPLLTKIGAKDCEQFLPPSNKVKKRADTTLRL